MKTVALFMLIFLFSCGGSSMKGEKDKDVEPSQIVAKTNLDSIMKDQIIEKFKSRYDLQYSWDTLDYRYTFAYNSVLKTKNQLIEEFYIIDIFQKNEKLFLSILVEGDRYFYFDLEITQEQVNDLLKEDKLALVVSITNLKKIKFELSGQYEPDMAIVDGEIDDNSWGYINVDNSRDFVGNGILIDLIDLKSVSK